MKHRLLTLSVMAGLIALGALALLARAALVNDDHPALAVVDLTRMPEARQPTIALLLLLPVGAVLTSIFRTVIGVRTFGTFTPTLIALSFVFATWQTALVLLVLLVTLGLIGRSVLDRLRLLMVPRLSVILTLVVLMLVIGLSISESLGVSPSAHAAVLPVVIITMMIERMTLAVEEDGPTMVARQLAGTAFVALACYGVFRWASLGRLLVRYPEAHLFTLAALVGLGRYTGYRLTELWRFHDANGGDA